MPATKPDLAMIESLCRLPDDAPAQARLRAIGERLYADGGAKLMHIASDGAFDLLGKDCARADGLTFSRALHQAWAGVGEWRGRPTP